MRSLAIGIIGATLGAFAAPASGAEPTVEVDCSVDSFGQLLTGRFTNFPPDETFILWTYRDDSVTRGMVVDGYARPIDSTGSGDTGGGVYVTHLPAYIAVVLYRDLNGNGRWNSDVDETVYRGDGTVDACPGSITLSPK